jgi:hypothetical protein
MQLRNAFPLDTVTGACLVTGSSDLKHGPIVDLDLDLETLPAWGRICISAQGVRLLNTCLGWNVDPTIDDQLDQLRAERDELEEENHQLKEKLRTIADALRVSEVMALADAGSLIEASS